MGYKTILAHCDADLNVAHRLAIAVELAKRHDAYLVGVHIQEPFNAPAMFDGTVAMDSLFGVFEETAKANLASAKAAFAKAVKGTELSTEWRSEEGYIDARLTVHARYADLTVLGQANSAEPSLAPLDLPETMALSTGRPVLVVPHDRRAGRTCEDRHAVLERQPRKRARRLGCPAAVARGGQGRSCSASIRGRPPMATAPSLAPTSPRGWRATASR